MAAQNRWYSDPDSGGKKIPDAVKSEVTKRVNKVAEEQFRGSYNRLEIRFRGQFCYIDAYVEPDASEAWPPEDWPETRDEYLHRMRSTPVHLCRLRYFGGDQWGFAFYAYSSDQYELAMYPSGEFVGTPEEAFVTSATVYLNG